MKKDKYSARSFDNEVCEWLRLNYILLTGEYKRVGVFMLRVVALMFFIGLIPEIEDVIYKFFDSISFA